MMTKYMVTTIMSFIGAMMMLAAVPTACPPDDKGVKTEKKMVGDDFNIVRDEVIDGIRYITAAPSAIVCSVRIDIHLIDDVVDSVVYTRGCNGNAKGIGALIKGMKVDEAIRRLKGIDCAGRGTSCPDQLARVLEAAMSREPVTR